ncbi:5-oxoprolinase subunit PxpB [Azoarcus sp. L1K30]|uniref:5-oxoprolinase subunit PxpB n=1 Tax=Azoarcus sp. L1K30 TaxID=2820277 RepID=UPI001B84464E|nr:5-oxoprolinase subunit PxpB [Azoarcus sp. L1K30]MBR0567552.1 5-oxoprolinase subunit PxpB [Azoarcus sp. L1K30]
MSMRILDAGDAAFTVEFGDAIDPALLARVNALDTGIARLQAGGGLPGLIETMPTFRSLTVFFDPLQTGREALLVELAPFLADTAASAGDLGRHWRLPVCYEGELAPDLGQTAAALGIATDDVVALHAGRDYVVYMLGFLPGFPFMGDVPEALRLPRRAEPRLRVPAGSVAVANGLTAIYPWESPGGWHLLGRCPVPLFDAACPSPSLLAAGDSVRFEPVSMTEYRRLLDAATAGELDPQQWLATAAANDGGGAQ